MKKFLPYILSSFFSLLFLCASNSAQTQPFEQSQVFQQEQMSTALDDDGDVKPVDPYCDPQCTCRADGSICPIDDGLVALLAAGAVFGIVQIRRSRAALR
jgi:hypothetical protein